MTAITKPNTIDGTSTGDTPYSAAISKNEANITDLYLHLSVKNIGNYSSSLNTAITTIGSTETTLVIDETVTLTANCTQPSTLHLLFTRDGQIATDTYTLTVNGPVTTGGNLYQIFSGSGAVTWSNGQDFYPEYWGAISDYTGTTSTTDSTTAFENTMKSVYAGGGGVVRLRPTMQHVNNTGSVTGTAYYVTNPMLSMDTTTASGMPDGTTCNNTNQVKPISILGGGVGNTAVVFGGTGTEACVYLKGESGKIIRGKVRIDSMTLVGPSKSGTTYGIHCLDSVTWFNAFENLKIQGFGYGFWYDGYQNSIKNILCYGNDYGLYVDTAQSTHMDLIFCAYNRTEGLHIGAAAAITITNLTCNYNGDDDQSAVYQIVLKGGSDSIHFDTVYIEYPYGEDDGATARDLQAILLNPNDLTMGNITFTNLRIQPGQLTTENAANVHVFYISNVGNGDGGRLEGFSVDGITIGSLLSNASTVYVIENDDANRVTIAGAEYKRQNIAGASVTYDGIFDGTTTEREFSYVQDDQSNLARLKAVLPFALTFSWTNMADNSAGIAAVYESFTGFSGIWLPWGCDLTGLTYSTTATAGTITLVEGSLSGSFSQTISPGTSKVGTNRYDPGTHNIAANTKFDPTITTATLGDATSELIVTFFFSITIDEQDR